VVTVTEPGEQVFFHGHPSWLSMPGLYVKGLVGALIAGVLAGLASAGTASTGKVHSGWVIVAVFVVFALVSLRGYLRRLRTTYTITDRRLAIGTGLFSRAVHEARLERVQNVYSRQTMLERLLGVGTVDFDTAAGADFDFTFRGVADPRELARTVDHVLHDRERVLPWV
jgi:uncharacterized membrane protein YdbT with pleckstrin-like domain